MDIKIVESMEEYHDDLMRRVYEDKIEKPERGMVMTPETFSKVFSTERIRLLQRIYKNNIKNIYQLAKEMEKPYEVVFRNIKYLEGLGLVKVIDKDNKKIPTIKGKIEINFFPKQVTT